MPSHLAPTAPTLPTCVLVVDDDVAVLSAMCRVLRDADFDCVAAAGVNDAITALDGQRFDVLVCDIQMPGHTELSLVEKARDAVAPMAVILVTGHPDVSTAVKALKLSVLDYLLKPICPVELVSAVRRGSERARSVRHALAAREAARQGMEWAENMLAALEMPGISAAPTHDARSPETDALRYLCANERQALTRREVEVLTCFRQVLSVGKVASSLAISSHTVRSHFKAIYRKLGVTSQVALLAKLQNEKNASE